MPSTPAPFEIWLARVRYRDCIDIRPCVILDHPRDGKVNVFRISSSDLSKETAFRIARTSPDFTATGLSKDSYISDEALLVSLENIRKRKGALTGELLEDFRAWNWFGDPP